MVFFILLFFSHFQLENAFSLHHECKQIGRSWWWCTPSKMWPLEPPSFFLLGLSYVLNQPPHNVEIMKGFVCTSTLLSERWNIFQVRATYSLALAIQWKDHTNVTWLACMMCIKYHIYVPSQYIIPTGILFNFTGHEILLYGLFHI